MKIQGTNMVGSTNPYNRNQAKGLQATEKSKRKDELSISAEAKAMLDRMSGSEHPERRAKIEELKQQVATGTYQVQAGKVADKLLDWWK